MSRSKSSALPVELPDKLLGLLVPRRYKVLHGGRGSGKSWSVARALVALAASRPIRVLCARETQKSIQESVHRLIKDQIALIGLDRHFDVQEARIVGKNGSEFSFAGIRQQGIANLKSFEGVDVCWVEEAQVVTNRSWDVLVPTIRKPGSEIWITFNPELDTDPTYERFVINPPDGAWVQQVNWSDNPWFPPELDAERTAWAKRDPEGYRTVWEGQCRAAIEGAIYAREIAQMLADGRVCNVPYDPALKVHTVWDLGWNDAMSIIMIQRTPTEVRVIDHISDSFKRLDEYVSMLNQRGYNYGTDYLPHDGAAKDFKTGKSTQELMTAIQRNVQIVPNIAVEQGIKAARMLLPRVYVDKTKCRDWLQSLKRYRRSIPQTTNEPGQPLHDEASHDADTLRYLALVVDRMTNDAWKPIKYPALGVV